MIPSVNFNPSFANLTALRGLGGISHPVRPVGTPVPVNWGGAGTYSGLPATQTVQNPMPIVNSLGQGQPIMPANNLYNLQALLQLLGQR